MQLFATNGSKKGPSALTAFDHAQQKFDNIKYRQQAAQTRVEKMIQAGSKTTKEEKLALKLHNLKPAQMADMSDRQKELLLVHNQPPSKLAAGIKKVIGKAPKLSKEEKEARKLEAKRLKAEAKAAEKAAYKNMTKEEKKDFRDQKKQEREAEKERKQQVREAKAAAKDAKQQSRLNEFLLVAPQTWENRIHKERLVRLGEQCPCFWPHNTVETVRMLADGKSVKSTQVAPCQNTAVKESDNHLCEQHEKELNDLPRGHPKRAWFVAVQEVEPDHPEPKLKTLVTTADKVDKYWLEDASDKMADHVAEKTQKQEAADRRLWKKRYLLAVRNLVPKIPCVWSQFAGKNDVCLRDCSPKSRFPLCHEHATLAGVDSKCPERECKDHITPVDGIFGSDEFWLHHAHLKFYCHFELGASSSNGKPSLCQLRAVNESIHYCVTHATEMQRLSTASIRTEQFVDQVKEHVLHKMLKANAQAQKLPENRLARKQNPLVEEKVILTNKLEKLQAKLAAGQKMLESQQPLFAEPKAQPVPDFVGTDPVQREAFMKARADRERIKQEALSKMEDDDYEQDPAAYAKKLALFLGSVDLKSSSSAVVGNKAGGGGAAPMEGVIKTDALDLVPADQREAFLKARKEREQIKQQAAAGSKLEDLAPMEGVTSSSIDSDMFVSYEGDLAF